MTKTESGSRPEADYPGLRRPVFFVFVAALLAADLWTKDWAWGFVAEEHQMRALVEGWDWLRITRVYNSGGVFGLFQGFTTPLTIFRILAAAAIFWLVTRQPRANRIGVFTLALLAAGALGNLYDNLSQWLPWEGTGHVRDFVVVDLGFWPFHPWPVFNVADACITVGFVLLITGISRIRIHRVAAAPA